MNQDRYRDMDFRTTFIFNINYKNKKGKRAKNWETQYKSIWNGKKR